MTKIRIQSWGKENETDRTQKGRCLVPDCDYVENPLDKKAKRLTRGLCPTHYVYVLKTFDLKNPQVEAMLIERGVLLAPDPAVPRFGKKKDSLKSFLADKGIHVDTIATGREK